MQVLWRNVDRSLVKYCKRSVPRVLGVTALVWAALFSFSGRLAVGERSDPLFEAETLVSQGRWQAALGVLDGLGELPEDPWAARQVRLQRALALKELDRPAEALPLLLAGPNEPLGDYASFWMAECYEELGLSDDAAAAYEVVLSSDGSSLLTEDAMFRSARLLSEAGKQKPAAERFKTLLGSRVLEVEALIGLRKAQLAMGELVQARRTGLRLARDYPERAEALAILDELAPFKTTQEQFYAGVVYSRHGRTRDAVKRFRSVVKEANAPLWRGRAQYEMAVAYFERKDYRTAERVFDRAYALYRVPKALYQLGRCSVKRGRDVEAVGRFMKFADQYPGAADAAEAMWNAAMAWERQNRYDRSRELFLKLAARYPSTDFADKGRWRAGYALFRRAKYKEATESFLELADKTGQAYMRDQGLYWAGKSLAAMGSDKDAQALWQRAAEGFPLSYYSSRARSLLKSPPPETGLARLEHVDANPDYRLSRSMEKGDALASIGDYDAAESEYRRAEWLHRDDLFALADLQQRYERLGAMNRALRLSYRMMEVERNRGESITLTSFKRLYPTYYWGEISRMADKQKVDPNLVLAIIRQESSFNEEAVSPVGARGLMQVMPATGRHLARKMRIRNFSTDDLWNPHTSIQMGTIHLSDHLKKFNEDDDRGLSLALSAYNAGVRVARRWDSRFKGQDVDEFVESIPYRETRNYVKLVYRNYKVYSYLQDQADLQALVQ